jgi:hypothetical protein
MATVDSCASHRVGVELLATSCGNVLASIDTATRPASDLNPSYSGYLQNATYSQLHIQSQDVDIVEQATDLCRSE